MDTREAGRLGGLVRSSRKLAAVRENIKKAHAARQARRVLAQQQEDNNGAK